MRSVDVDGAGVWLDQGFEPREIMHPGVFRFPLPSGDRGAGGLWNGEGTFVNGSFHDDVIPWTEQRMEEKKDSFFRGGYDEDIVCANVFVERCERFAEPGSAGGFGVTAPVFEESLVSGRFQSE